MANSEESVLNYILRRSLDTGVVQEPISEISTATGVSTATVWRALQNLEDKGAIEIIKTSDNKEANKIKPRDMTKSNMQIFEQWITQGEDLVDLSRNILKNFRHNKELIEDLQKQLEMYREKQERIIKVVPFGDDYELVVRRTGDAKEDENNGEDKAIATLLVEILKNNLDNAQEINGTT